MDSKPEKFLIYGFFASFFMGIFTFEVFFFLVLIYNLSTSRRWWQGFRPWLVQNKEALLFFAGVMPLAAIYQQFVSEPGDFGFHWAFAAIWLLTYDQVKRLDFRLLHRVLLIASTPGLIYSIYWLTRPAEIEWALQSDLGFGGFPRASGFLSNPITHAEGLIILLGWSLARLKEPVARLEKRLIIGHAGLALLIMLASRVRAGLLGFMALMLLHGLLSPRHRKLCIAFVVICVLAMIPTVALFGFNLDSITERVVLIKHNLGLIMESPILGIGPDRFHFHPLPENPDLPCHPHNTIVGVTTEMGLLGLFSFGLFMVHLFNKYIRVYRMSPQEGGLEPWVMRALMYQFLCFWLLGIFDYNFADTELLMIHALHWAIILRTAQSGERGATQARAVT